MVVKTRGSKKPNPRKLAWLCRVRNISIGQVVAVDFEADDIILVVRGLGQVRVERSALPATIEALPDVIEETEPVPVGAVAQPAPGQKRAHKAGKRGEKKRKP
jgi:hypothetical protein